MSFMTLSPNSRAMLSDIEKSIKDKYMTKVKEMSATELKAFIKHKCMKQMVEEIEILFPRVNPKIIADGCLPISNALNNECQSLLARSKRKIPSESKKVIDDVHEAPVDQIAEQHDDTMDTLDHELLLSDSFQQLAISTSFLHGTQDQIEIEKHLIENDIATIKVTMEKTEQKRTSTSDNGKKEKENTRRSTKKKNETTINCTCEGRITGSGMIQCNWCMEWYHDICVGLTEKDTVQFWICTECRDLPKIVRRIENHLITVIENNQKVTKQ